MLVARHSARAAPLLCRAPTPRGALCMRGGPCCTWRASHPARGEFARRAEPGSRALLCSLSMLLRSSVARRAGRSELPLGARAHRRESGHATHARNLGRAPERRAHSQISAQINLALFSARQEISPAILHRHSAVFLMCFGGMCFGGASSLVGGFGGSIRLNNHHSHTQPAQIQGHRVYLMSKEEKPTTTTSPSIPPTPLVHSSAGERRRPHHPRCPKTRFGSTAFFFYCRAGRAALSFPRRENQPGFAVRRMAPRTTKRVKEEEGEAREGGGRSVLSERPAPPLWPASSLVTPAPVVPHALVLSSLPAPPPLRHLLTPRRHVPTRADRAPSAGSEEVARREARRTRVDRAPRQRKADIPPCARTPCAPHRVPRVSRAESWCAHPHRPASERGSIARRARTGGQEEETTEAHQRPTSPRCSTAAVRTTRPLDPHAPAPAPRGCHSSTRRAVR